MIIFMPGILSALLSHRIMEKNPQIFQCIEFFLHLIRPCSHLMSKIEYKYYLLRMNNIMQFETARKVSIKKL